MAKQPSSNDVEIDLNFPLEGINEERAYSRQRPGTTIDAQNVRSFEPTTGRARGCQRGGLVKFFDALAVTTTVPGQGGADGVVYPIQCVTHLVTTDDPPPADYGRFSYAQAAGSGFGIGNGSSGASLFSGIGNDASFQLANSCWDEIGNLYVAMVNQTTGAVTVRAVNASGATVAGVADGAVIWSNTALTCATGSARNVPGMVCTSTHLFVALTTTTPPVAGQAHCRIARFNKATGVLTDPTWRIGSVYITMTFSTASINCLCAIGNMIYFLIVFTATEGFIVAVDGTTGTIASGPGLYSGVSASVAATAANTKTRIVTDGSSLYVVSPTSTSQVKKYTGALIKEWSTTAADGAAGVNDITFDRKNSQLVAICDAAPSIRALSLTTGALSSSATLGGVFYDTIDCDAQGTYVLWKNSQASNDTLALSATALGTLWGPTTRANAVHTGSSVNRGSAAIPPTVGPRVIRPLLVAGGEVRRFTEDGPIAITNGRSFSQTAKQIFAAQNGANIFFVDGAGYYYYKAGGTVANLNTIQAWTPTSGTLPVGSPVPYRARGICTWHGRTVLWGLVDNPQVWYMSKVLDPFNWNYSPTPTTTAMATNGLVAKANVQAKYINCMIPFSDDTLVALCDDSIWILKGDPLLGGVWDQVSRGIGSLAGEAYAIDENQQIYFYAPVGGIFKMTPGAQPMRVSQQIERQLDNIDVSANTISMAWDMQLHALMVWVTPHDSTKDGTNFCFEERTQSWVKDKYAKKGHQPFAIHEYDGDSPEDRKIFVGGRDGYLRIMSNDAADDDGFAIKSYAWIGPLTNRQWDDLMLKELQATLGVDSGDVSYDVYVGRTVEEAYESKAVVSGKWTAGRNHVSPVNRSGFAIFVKLSASSPFQIERIRAKYAPLGSVRRIM